MAEVRRPLDHAARHVNVARNRDADRAQLLQGHARASAGVAHGLPDALHSAGHASFGVGRVFGPAQHGFAASQHGGAHIRAAQVYADHIRGLFFRLYAKSAHADSSRT